MEYALPIVIATAAWWLSTVVLIYRAGLERDSFRMTLAATTAVMVIGAVALFASRDDVSASGAYLAFFGGLAIWAWHEVTYQFGFITGPQAAPCPPGATGWRRFQHGLRTCLYHELAVVATAAVLLLLFWSAPNQVGLWTFVILWLMRWSAKLNIFLGVRNLHDEFWPAHLRYLKTYVRERPMNPLFPVSITAATGGVIVLAFVAAASADMPGRQTGATLLATLLSLAMFEHWMLVLRVRDELLWQPGFRRRRDAPTAVKPGEGPS